MPSRARFGITMSDFMEVVRIIAICGAIMYALIGVVAIHLMLTKPKKEEEL